MIENQMVISRRVERPRDQISGRQTTIHPTLDWLGMEVTLRVRIVIHWYEPGQDLDWDTLSAAIVEIGDEEYDVPLPAEALGRIASAIETAKPDLVRRVAEDILDRDGPDWDAETDVEWEP